MFSLSLYINSKKQELSEKAAALLLEEADRKQLIIDQSELKKIFDGILTSIVKDLREKEVGDSSKHYLNRFCIKLFGKKFPYKINIERQNEILTTSRVIILQDLAIKFSGDMNKFQESLHIVNKAFDINLKKLCHQWDHAFHKIQQEDLRLINELKIVKNDLQDQLNIIYQLIKNSPIAVIGCDKNFNVQIWNNMASRITGFQQADVLKKNLMTFLTQSSQIQLKKKLQSKLKLILKIRLNILSKKSGQFPALVSVSKLDYTYSENLHYIISFIDLRGEEKIQSQMKQINQLIALSRLSGAIMHDIRNPINSIGLNIELLDKILKQNNQTQQDAKEIINTIFRQIDQLKLNLNQYLGYSRFKEFYPEPIKISSYLNDLILELQIEYASKNIRLEYKESENDYWIMGDWMQLRRVFINLIQNAIEAIGEKGLIRTNLRKRNNRLHIKVQDNGPGIEVDQVKKIFEPYFSTKNTGTGLGLYIAREIVLAHNGRISCISKPGNGTQFTVSFPIIEAMNFKGEAIHD